MEFEGFLEGFPKNIMAFHVVSDGFRYIPGSLKGHSIGLRKV